MISTIRKLVLFLAPFLAASSNAQNLVQNPYFDDGLSQWLALAPERATWTNLMDVHVDESSRIGSVQLDSHDGPAVLAQCVPIDYTTYVATVWVNSICSGQTLQVFWSDDSCVAGAASFLAQSTDTATWQRITALGMAPTGATRAIVTLENPAACGNVAYFDVVTLQTDSFLAPVSKQRCDIGMRNAQSTAGNPSRRANGLRVRKRWSPRTWKRYAMLRPAFPDDEIKRLADLHELDILDTIPEQAYDDLTRIATGICGTPIGLVSLIDGDRQWFKSRQGIDTEETPRDVAFCAHALLTPNDLFVVADAKADPRFADNPLVTGDPNVRFYAGAPLVSPGGNALGTLCVIDKEPRQLESFQYDALRGLSRQVVALMELRRTTKSLRHQLQERVWYENHLKQVQEELQRENASLSEASRTDVLTGLPNRRSLNASLERAIVSARSTDASLCVALIDVDHFKTINDLHGHAEGDRVLAAIARALHAQKSAQGFVARYGGEEFAMLLPSTKLDAAELQCDYARIAVQNLDLGLPVTVSIGLAMLTEADSAATICARADEALYAAKRNGRNRVEVVI